MELLQSHNPDYEFNILILVNLIQSNMFLF